MKANLDLIFGLTFAGSQLFFFKILPWMRRKKKP